MLQNSYLNKMKEQDFYLEVFNWKYNTYLPVNIIGKLSESIVKIECYVFDKEGNLKEKFETCCFWENIRTRKSQDIVNPL